MSDRYLCVKKSSENFLKMIKAECAQIITLSFNSNRKFSINKNVYLNMLKAVEIDEYQLNSLINAMRISISLSAFISEGNEFNCLFHQFVPIYNRVHFIKLLRKMNNYIITVLNFY